ncbi:hypothetical protein JL720_9393 [Aureococcus anophagefferens]|nr:hypothetical protein JL720_9393 [Aureococcus anophagefferens]
MDQTSTSRCAARGPPQRFAAAAARFRSSDAADQVHEAEKQLVLEYADKLIREVRDRGARPPPPRARGAARRARNRPADRSVPPQGGVTVDMAYSVALETFFTESDDRAPAASPRVSTSFPTAETRAGLGGTEPRDRDLVQAYAEEISARGLPRKECYAAALDAFWPTRRGSSVAVSGGAEKPSVGVASLMAAERPLNSPTAGRRAAEPGADVDMGDPVARAANVDMGERTSGGGGGGDSAGDFDPTSS